MICGAICCAMMWNDVSAQVTDHLNNGAATRTQLKITNSNSTGGLFFGINSGNAGGTPGFIRLKDNKPLKFFTNDLERMRIDANGFVGINTTNPATSLDVDGMATVRNLPNDNSLVNVVVADGNGLLHIRDASTIGGGGGADDDWERSGNDLFTGRAGIGVPTLPTGNLGVGTLPSAAVKFFTLSDDNAVTLAGSFNKITGPGQVGIPIGVRGAVVGGPGFSRGVEAIASSNESGASVTGVNSIASGTNNAAFGIQTNTTGTSTNIAVGVQSTAANNAPVQYGVQATSGRAVDNTGFNAGVRTIGFGTDLNASSSNYGVHATAHPGTMTATNIAVQARAIRPPSGVPGNPAVNYGLFAEADNDGVANCAGFFNGDICGTGTFTYTSDAKLKQNVAEMKDALAILNKLEPKTYTFKNEAFPRMMLPEGNQYGLIAQDLEKVLPELVQPAVLPALYNEEGKVEAEAIEFKSVNYNALIPILVQGIKEQQAQIDAQNKKLEEADDLKEELDALKAEMEALKELLTRSPNVTTMTLSGNQQIILNQNAPNPFKEKTTITYVVPTNVRVAEVLFYDFNGKLIKKQQIQTGQGQIDVYAEDLAEGTYTYSIVADGEVVGTKRMMLIK